MRLDMAAAMFLGNVLLCMHAVAGCRSVIYARCDRRRKDAADKSKEKSWEEIVDWFIGCTAQSPPIRPRWNLFVPLSRFRMPSGRPRRTVC
jgi:hypothetical protein